LQDIKLAKVKDVRPRKVYAFKAELSADQVALAEMIMESLHEVWNKANVKKDTARLIHRLRKQHNREAPESATLLDNKALDKELSLMRAKQYWPKDSVQQLIPTPYRDSTIKALKDAWSRFYKDYKSGVGPPKFKSRIRPIRSLIDRNGVTTIKVFPCQENSKNAWVQFPRPSDKALPWLGKIKIKGFYKRFPAGLEYGKVALVKDASDWFVQFTAVCPTPKADSLALKKIGVDPGVKLVVATSEGIEVKAKAQAERTKRRFKRLQRKLARQQKGSASREHTKQKIAAIHAKARRSRKAYNAYLADWLGRYDVAFEGSQLRNMTRKAKPKPNEEGTGYLRNGAAAKSGLNRELLDRGIGQLRDLTEARCKSRGHTYIKTEAKDVPYTSRKCHCCGEKGRRPKQEVFICLNQGCDLFHQEQNADVNAAKNHLKAVSIFRQESTRVPSEEVKRGESRATVAGQPDSGLLSVSLATANGSSPEAQASVSVKENVQLLTVKGKRGMGLKHSSSVLDPCSSQHKGSSRSRSRRSGVSVKRVEVLEFSAQESCQLELWGNGSAEYLSVDRL
jgi:putative transposase